MRILFMGTPDFAVPTLGELVGQGHEIAAVYTRAPAAAGRGMAERPSPVQALAERLGLIVETPRSLRGDAAAEAVAAHGADLAVVVAYGLILPQAVLDAPALGCLNLHASLLPRWRGAAPIHRAVMAGDSETGVAIMRMEAGLDTGPVAMMERIPIAPEATTGDLHDRLARLGADLMARAVGALARDALTFTPQNEAGVTYAHKIDKAEARIVWDRPAEMVRNQIHGLSPHPGAFFEIETGGAIERVKVLRARLADGAGPPGRIASGEGLVVTCGSGALELLELQRAGKAPLPAAAVLRGTRWPPGTVLR